jgi:hypothetical protein
MIGHHRCKNMMIEELDHRTCPFFSALSSLHPNGCKHDDLIALPDGCFLHTRTTTAGHGRRLHCTSGHGWRRLLHES